MSQVARVFVVLNLLIAAGFLFAASTFLALNNDYKKELAKEQEAKANLEQEMSGRIETLEAEKKDLANQNRALQERNANLTGSADTLNQQVRSLEAEKQAKDTQIADLTRNLHSMQATVDRHHNDLVTMTTENKDLNEQARTARKGELDARNELNGANDTIRERENTIVDLEKGLEVAMADVAQKALMIDYARNRGIDFENLMLMDPAAGTVVNADNTLKFVMMNLGSSKGVKRGYVFDIVRGGKYIGRCRVDEVYPEMSSATVTLLKPGEMVMIGDRVTNTLN